MGISVNLYVVPLVGCRRTTNCYSATSASSNIANKWWTNLNIPTSTVRSAGKLEPAVSTNLWVSSIIHCIWNLMNLFFNFYAVFNIGGNLVQFSGATTLSSNSAAAVTQASGAVNTAVTSAATASGSGNSAQIQPINVPQTVGVSGSNIVMVNNVQWSSKTFWFMTFYDSDGTWCWWNTSDSTNSSAECRTLGGRTLVC